MNSNKKRIVLFCERNVRVGGAKEVVDMLNHDYQDELEVHVVDCFKRCLECAKKPFCKMQLKTIEADNAQTLVQKILHS